ncbi:hypothetical protein [Streptomyces aureus]|uniref:hypothetical protein n=1 Tax=Streptomyces aureus TaxID=193461 RepID=UPI00131BB21D|nr:hypothetical protein [Streptomyces aureus]
MSTLFSIDQPRGSMAELDAPTRIAIGDELLREFPDKGGWRSTAFNRAASRLKVSVDLGRDCAALAKWLSLPMRDHVFGRVSVSYTVLREAAFDYSRSGMPDHQRWDALRTMIDAALANGRTRITATAYRRMIGARPVPNQADAMSPEAIVRQMDRPDVWSAVLDYIAANPTSRKDVLMRIAE